MNSKVTRIAIAASSFAGVITASQSASAQLNVGNGIPQGLEYNYLQYQVSGRDLSQMRGIPACSVGFGVSCNKAGAVFQQLLESNGGPTYEQLLMQAAGGEENYQNFASLYNNNPNLSQIPYASFWQDPKLDIVDGYQYLLGQTVNQTPIEGLEQVTQNFHWAPEGVENSLDPRSGLLDLKYSYGRLLLEEVAKIPDALQQIQSLGLEPALTQYYSDKLSRAMRVVNAGNEQALKKTVLEVLSMPYTPDAAEFNRPNYDIPQAEELTGDTLAGEVLLGEIPVSLQSDVISAAAIDIPSSLAEVELLPETPGKSFPSWLVGGGGLALLLLLLSLGGDGSSGQGPSTVAVVPPVNVAPPSDVSTPPLGGGGSPIIDVPVTNPPGQEVTQVPEPSTITPLLFLIIFIYVLNLKHWRTQTRG